MPRTIQFSVCVLWSLCATSVIAKFPNNPKPCKFEDSQCIINVTNYLLKDKNQGDNSFNLVKLDPLKVSKIEIKQSADSPVNINLVFLETRFIGLKDMVVYNIKGFGRDLTQRHEIKIKAPRVVMLAQYKVNGKVLILPITGKGESNITIVNAEISIAFEGSPVVKDGKTFMEIKNMKVDGIPDRLYYRFDNLFNGDKELSDNTNLFLNENWREIFMELRASLYAALGKIFTAVIDRVFIKYPYEDYFEKAT